MKTDDIFQNLKEIAKKAGIEVRFDSIFGQGGYCKANGKELIVINSGLPVEVNIKTMCNSLNKINLNNIYIPPFLREIIENNTLTPQQFLEK